MNPLDEILALAANAPRRIVLPEGEDPRIIEGAIRAARDGIAQPILIGAQDNIRPNLAADVIEKIEIVDPASSANHASYAREFARLRAHKGITPEAAAQTMREAMSFAAMMVRQGDADGSLGGAVATTADTIRAALQIIGRAKDAKLVSSFFLMALDGAHHDPQDVLVFADCGLIIDPSDGELVEIAIASADSFKRLVGAEPRVAMLSFSTAGSARHERVSRVAEAAKLARARRPDLKIDGDLQFDAAYVPTVSAAKAPNSPLQGRANVFIFPNLDAANIGYKIAQRIGGAQAIGPILQGLAAPANDLSRGCSAEDVYHMIAVTCVQAKQRPIQG